EPHPADLRAGLLHRTVGCRGNGPVALRPRRPYRHGGRPRGLLGSRRQECLQRQARPLRRHPRRAPLPGRLAHRRAPLPPAAVTAATAAGAATRSPAGARRLLAVAAATLSGAGAAWALAARLSPKGLPAGVVLLGVVMGSITALAAM